MKNKEVEYSKSKQKRMAIKEAEANKKKKKIRTRVIAGVAVVVIAGGTVGGAMVLTQASKNKYVSSEVEPETDYSGYLTNDGKIEDIKTSDYVGTFDPSSVEISASDVSYSEIDLNAYIDSIVEDGMSLDTDETRKAETGDIVNINYVGSIDGTEFDGGSADDQDLTLGSGKFVDGFEDQLVGAKPGDDITVKVTFPDDYGNDELNGKDAEFAVHVNGIYTVPEFNDAYVSEYTDGEYDNVNDYLTDYRQSQIDNLYAEAIDSWIEENVTLDSYPEVYLHHMEGLTMTSDAYLFEQYKNFYDAYGIDFDYDDYQEFFATEDQTYEESRDAKAKAQVTKDIVYQNVFENAGLTISDDDYNNFLETNNITDEIIENYGKPYVMKQMMQELASEYMWDLVTVIEDEAEDEIVEDAVEDTTTDESSVEATEIDETPTTDSETDENSTETASESTSESAADNTEGTISDSAVENTSSETAKAD